MEKSNRMRQNPGGAFKNRDGQKQVLLFHPIFKQDGDPCLKYSACGPFWRLIIDSTEVTSKGILMSSCRLQRTCRGRFHTTNVIRHETGIQSRTLNQRSLENDGNYSVEVATQNLHGNGPMSVYTRPSLPMLESCVRTRGKGQNAAPSCNSRSWRWQNVEVKHGFRSELANEGGLRAKGTSKCGARGQLGSKCPGLLEPPTCFWELLAFQGPFRKPV